MAINTGRMERDRDRERERERERRGRWRGRAQPSGLNEVILVRVEVE